MADFIIAVILLLLVGAAVSYIVKEKKRGVKCIGCPAEGGCAHSHGAVSGCSCGCSGSNNESAGSCGCGCHTDTK